MTTYEQLKKLAAQIYGWQGADATAYAVGYLTGVEEDKPSLTILADEYQKPARRGYDDGMGRKSIKQH